MENPISCMKNTFDGSPSIILSAMFGKLLFCNLPILSTSSCKIFLLPAKADPVQQSAAWWHLALAPFLGSRFDCSWLLSLTRRDREKWWPSSGSCSRAIIGEVELLHFLLQTQIVRGWGSGSPARSRAGRWCGDN